MLVIGEDDDDDDEDGDHVTGIKRGRRSRDSLDAWGRPFDRRPSEDALARKTMQVCLLRHGLFLRSVRLLLLTTFARCAVHSEETVVFRRQAVW